MTSDTWPLVDAYIADKTIPDGEAQLDTLRANAAAKLPQIDVSAPQGKFLHLLARSIGACKILEIGTLGGYSTIWLARALAPGGVVVTVEFDARHADVARANIAREGVADRVDLRVGAALDVLPMIAKDPVGPFDLTFIDADKANNAAYFDWAVRLSRSGSWIVVDNVVRDGAILDASGAEPGIVGTRKLFDSLKADARVDATALQTVGSKGWDGLLLALVK